MEGIDMVYKNENVKIKLSIFARDHSRFRTFLVLASFAFVVTAVIPLDEANLHVSQSQALASEYVYL